MSLPKPTSSPSLSSQPSKQSLHHPTSRPQSINQQQPDEHPSPQPQPHIAADIDSHPAKQADQAHHESAQNILSQSFFTLIEDAHTSEYYHPTVHYIFSDDDTDIVTEAALRSLEAAQDPTASASNTKPNSRATQQHHAEQHPGTEEGSYEESPTRKESFLPDPVPGVRDNYIILDIDHITPDENDYQPAGAPAPSEPRTQASQQPSGQTPDSTNPSNSSNPQTQSPFPPQGHLNITSAHSLSPSWQVLNTKLLPAPTFETNSPAENPASSNANGGLMLQIQGTSGLPGGPLAKEKERGGQRLEDMMDQFARRLDELRLVIERGERGGAMDAGDGDGDAVGAEVYDASLAEGIEAQAVNIIAVEPATGPDEARQDAVPGEQ